MHAFSRSEKRRLRDLTGVLYEREVKESLVPLARKFDEWKAGTITSLELSHILHEYDYGESRRLWSRYGAKREDLLVALGFVRGLLTEAEIGEDLFRELREKIDHCRELDQ